MARREATARDRGAAQRLRERIERAPEREASLSLRELRHAFDLPRGPRGRRAPRPAERERVARALAAAKLELGGSLDELTLEEHVVVRAAAEPAEVPAVGVARLWRFTTRAARTAYAAIGVVLTLVAFVALFPHTKPVARMTGDFNVAVAELSVPATADADGRRAAQSISAGIGTKLARRLSTPASERLGAQVRGPDQIGALAHPPADAPRLATHIAADVVVFGRIGSSAAGTDAAPGIYISPRVLPGAQEVSGTFAFGPPIVVRGTPSNPVTLGILERRLTDRVATLTDFVLGLSSFQIHDYGRAYAAFHRIERAGTWGPRRSALIELFLGNAALREGRLALADRHYTLALRREPGLLRAQFARTEVDFLRHKGACERDLVNAAVVRHGLSRYLAIERALRASSAYADRVLRAKAAFGAGRAYLCLSQALVADDWAAARAQLDGAIALSAHALPDLAEIAAQAHGGLALVAMPSADDHAPRNELLRATHEYHVAIALLGGAAALPERHSLQAILRSNLAAVDVRLGDRADAERQLARAVRLERASDTAATYLRMLVVLHGGHRTSLHALGPPSVGRLPPVVGAEPRTPAAAAH